MGAGSHRGADCHGHAAQSPPGRVHRRWAPYGRRVPRTVQVGAGPAGGGSGDVARQLRGQGLSSARRGGGVGATRGSEPDRTSSRRAGEEDGRLRPRRRFARGRFPRTPGRMLLTAPRHWQWCSRMARWLPPALAPALDAQSGLDIASRKGDVHAAGSTSVSSSCRPPFAPPRPSPRELTAPGQLLRHSIGPGIGLDDAKKVAAAVSAEARKKKWFMAIASSIRPAPSSTSRRRTPTRTAARTWPSEGGSAALYKRPTKAFQTCSRKAASASAFSRSKAQYPSKEAALLVDGKLVGRSASPAISPA